MASVAWGFRVTEVEEGLVILGPFGQNVQEDGFAYNFMVRARIRMCGVGYHH